SLVAWEFLQLELVPHVVAERRVRLDRDIHPEPEPLFQRRSLHVMAERFQAPFQMLFANVGIDSVMDEPDDLQIVLVYLFVHTPQGADSESGAKLLNGAVDRLPDSFVLDAVIRRVDHRQVADKARERTNKPMLLHISR